MSKAPPPVKKFKLRRVEVAVWAKEDKDDGYVRYKLTVQKSYKDKDTGEYVNSTFLFPEEAAVAAALIPQALGWISWVTDQSPMTGKLPEAEPVEKPF